MVVGKVRDRGGARSEMAWLNSGDMRWMGIGSQHVIHLHANAVMIKCVGKIPSLYLYLSLYI